MQYNRKPIPRSILIFGAGDHIGGPLAGFLEREAPAIKLRLATHSISKVETLRAIFPSAEVVIADYSDVPSLTAAAAGMEGIFVVTPAELDERAAMTNLVEAVRASGTLIQMIRIMGLHPDENPKQIPQAMRDSGHGAETQHLIARQILDDSGLPVTHLNSGATFMDNFVRLGQAMPVREQRKLIWPEHLVPFIDPRDLAEVAGRLFLSDNHRYIGQFHTANNGHDLLRYQDVADLMSEVYGEPITFDGSKEAFFGAFAAAMGPMCGFIWDYMQYEQDNETVWSLNDFAERILGRKPKTLREWLIEHRAVVLGEG